MQRKIIFAGALLVFGCVTLYWSLTKSFGTKSPPNKDKALTHRVLKLKTPEPMALEKEYQNILQEYEKVRLEFIKACRDIEDEDIKKRMVFEKSATLQPFVNRMLVLAMKNPEDPKAFNTFIEMVTGSFNRESDQALETLVKNYITSEKLLSVCQHFAFSHIYLDSTVSEKFLREVIEKSPHPEIQAYACFGLAKFYKRNGKQEEEEKIFEQVTKKYNNINFSSDGIVHFPPGITLASLAEGELFETRYLAIGKVAPEIEGRDADDKPFKLSDYHGKVIVLDFFGNWCPPCRAMYPHERLLVEDFKNKPFAILGINSDEDKETLKESIKEGEVTWRCWWDKGQEGPISSKWNIHKWPMTYVMDHKGVIRYKDLRDEELAQAVNTLLKEQEKESKAAKKPKK